MTSSKQIIMRLGEPYAYKDIERSFRELSTTVYFMEPDDLVFSAVIIGYPVFMTISDTEKDPDIFEESIWCFAWKLVKEIDSPIYIREVLEGEGFQEEKWSDIGVEELRSLDIIVDTSIVEEMAPFAAHSKKIKRDLLLKEIIDDNKEQ
jgi:hypothetical protein